MGKSQKKRAMRRHNPVRVPDAHLPKGLASAAASSSKNEAILPVMQKVILIPVHSYDLILIVSQMTSPDSSERKWSCVAVSNLIQNDPSTRRLLQGKNVVAALITRLTDDDEEVVIEAAGALRCVLFSTERSRVISALTFDHPSSNLCIDGGYDICAEMYNKNILAPLKTFIPKV